MYRSGEIYLPRKKKVPETFHSNTFRIFDENVSERLELDQCCKNNPVRRTDSEQQNLKDTHHIPHPYYAKFIRSNARSLNAPIFHMETDSTMADQCNWWPNGTGQNVRHDPPYSRASTQQTAFQGLLQSCAPSTRYGNSPNKSPSSGIVPTVSPIAHTKVLQEQMSFIHQYDSRKLQNQPYQGKRHGAFVWTEIKPASKPRAPGGADAFLTAERSRCVPAQQKAQGGSRMTSPELVSQHPRQMSDAGAGFSKGGLEEATRAYPRIPAREKTRQGVPQTAGLDSVPSKKEAVPSRGTPAAPREKFQDRTDSTYTNFSAVPKAAAVIKQPLADAQVGLLDPSADNNPRHQLTPVGS
nr:PREDICTED: uncharacterized protein C2orf73 homolog isoform X1 [Lepisosteus oculatus]